MKKMITALTLVMMVGVAAASFATIDWVGNEWPTIGSTIQDDQDLTVYLQIYKGGVTDGPGQGAGITAQAVSSFGNSYGLTYNTDIGNNDEYMVIIPFSEFQAGDWLTLDFFIVDESDGSTTDYTVWYEVNHAQVNDIVVTFSLCLDGVDYHGPPCVTGSATELGEWIYGVELNNVGGDLWEASVLISSATPNPIEFKYKRNTCSIWEDMDNRVLVRPTGVTTLVLDTVSWEDGPGICETVATEETSWEGLKAQYR